MALRRLSAVAKIGSLVAEALHARKQCEAILEPLHDMISYDAVFLAGRDEFTGSHAPMLTEGYNSTLLSFLSSDYQDCFSYRNAAHSGSAMRMQDYGTRFYDTTVYRGHLKPEGYCEGVTLVLRTDCDRPVGLLTMSFRNLRGIDDEARQALTMIGPLLGRLVDMWSTGHLQELSNRSQRSYLVDAHGVAVETSQTINSNEGRLTEEIVEGARKLIGNTPAGFDACGYVPLLESSAWQKVVVRVGRHVRRPCAFVFIQQSVLPYELTSRELDVLTLAGGGLRNNEIGAVLGIRTRTVSTHIERVLFKTGTSNRTELASRVVSEGLFRFGLHPYVRRSWSE